MEQAFRYRLYPTPEQEILLRRTMGCARLVYNRALSARTEAWYERQQRVDYVETSSMLSQWKKQEDLQFLNEESSRTIAAGFAAPSKGVQQLLQWQSEVPHIQEET